MRKSIVSVIFLLFISGADAQVPGYMGLRWSIQYQGSISPQWNNLDWSPMPYYSHNIQLGYVVSRRYEVGLQYTHIFYGSTYNRGAYIGDYENDNYLTIAYRTFNANNLTAYIKFFRDRKGFIAPLGRYFILGLSYQNSKDRFLVSPAYNSAYGAPFYEDAISQDIAFMAGVGRNLILADRLILSFEGDLGIPLTAIGRVAANPTAYYGTNTPANLYIHNNAADVMLMNLIQIKIGLGLLAF